MTTSLINIVLSGTEEGDCTMIEGDAKNVDYTVFLQCIQFGLEHCSIIARNINNLAKEYGKNKETPVPEDVSELVDNVKTLTEGKLRSIFTDSSLDKQARDKKVFAIRDDTVARYIKTNPNLSEAFTTVIKDVVKDLIFNDNHRVDGRKINQVRPITCDVNLYDPLHGSAMFQRGQTQVLCTVTLDSLYSAQKLDPMSVITGGIKEKNFLLHYEFPSYATGEVRSGGAGANRRETGHGALAERALRQVIPDNLQWTVRLTSEVIYMNVPLFQLRRAFKKKVHILGHWAN